MYIKENCKNNIAKDTLFSHIRNENIRAFCLAVLKQNTYIAFFNPEKRWGLFKNYFAIS